MKYAVLGFGLLVASVAQAQMIPSTGNTIPVFQGRGGSSSGGGGNGGGGINRHDDSDSETKAATRPRKTAEDKQRERDYKDFSRIYNKHEYTQRIRDEWLAFAKRTNWMAAWYNFGITAWRLGELDAADAAFSYIIQHGNYSDIEDAKKNRYEVQQEMGFASEKAGEWDMARVHFYNMTVIQPWNQHPQYLTLASYYLQANDEAGYRKAFEEIKAFASKQYNDDTERPATIRLYHLCWEQLQWFHAVDYIRNYNMPAHDPSWLPHAEEYLRKAIQFDDQTGMPMDNARAVLASVLEVEGKDDEAIDQALKVMKISPNNETAKLVLDQVAAKRKPKRDDTVPSPRP